jgi:uncharacterized membrane protein
MQKRRAPPGRSLRGDRAVTDAALSEAPEPPRPGAAWSTLRSGIFWILVSELCFALMRVATRWGASDLPGLEIGGVRFLGGALVAWAVAAARKAPLRVGDQKNAWLRSIFGTLNGLAVFSALGSHRIALGDVATLSATAPLFVALLSGPVLGERVTGRVVAGAAVGFLGVGVLSRPALHVSGDLALALLVGSLSYALALLRLRRLGVSEGSEAIALHMSLVAGAPQSFVQQISQPYYLRRPVVPLPKSAQLTPQTHEGGLATGTATLSGEVTDTSGAVLPGVTVRARGDAGVAGEAVTDEEGRYRLRLAPGDYRLSFELIGFKTADASVNLGDVEASEQNVSLEVAQLTETVTVAAERERPVASPPPPPAGALPGPRCPSRAASAGRSASRAARRSRGR